MNLKRKLKLFWTEHRDPILFWSIVIIVVIFITQSLNAMAISKANKEQEASNELINENIITITKEEEKDNEEVIEKFLKYCTNGNIDRKSVV